METKIAIIKDLDKDIKYIEEAAKVIKTGGTVVFPTETVYGLGADALNEEAVKKIFMAKGRPQDNPLILHVASKDISSLVKEVPPVAQELINEFWPGPLTIIFNKKDIVPDITSANLKSIGIRMPEDKIALMLIKLSKTPIAGPSANISGRPSPTDVERCIEDLSGKVDYILGGEKSRVGVESTIVDCTVDPPIVLRPGGITIDNLKKINTGIELDIGLMTIPTGDFKPKAPGMKYRHYAPKAKVIIVSGNREKTIDKINKMVHNYMGDGKQVGILASMENSMKYKEGKVIVLGSVLDLEEVARNLFESLRSFDDIGVDLIIAEAFEEKGVGVAIMNRLKKAAGYDIVEI